MRKSRRQRRQDKPARQSPQPPPPAVHAGRGAVALALVTFAVVFAVLDVASYTKTSATWDEPIHIAAGYAALTQHDYRVDPEHPPFLRMWAALPLLAMDGIKLDTGAIDRAEPNVWALTTLLNFCHRFLYVDNDGDRLLYSARFMIVLLGWTLGVLIFYWVDEWLGFWPAVVALALYTFEPNIEAHSSLVTTDFGAACFMFGAVYFLWRTCQRWSIANLVGLVVFFVLAIASKFSAMILGPIVALLLAISALRFRLLNVRTAVGILVLLACSAWIGIWAIYGFRHAPSSSSSWLFHLQDSRLVQQRVPDLAQLIAWVDDHHLLPNVFSQGFLIGQAKAQERSAFLAGSYSNTGWWYYFPVAFLIKTPLSAIILALGGAVLCVARWRSASQRTTFLLVPVAVYLAAAMGSHINIGLRHILPIYPFALVLAAGAAAELMAMRRYAAKGILAVLAIFWMFEFARAYPSNIAFFNQTVGGPRNGYKYLADSNIDWGQDLKGLKRWMDTNGVAHINLAYFGNAAPAYYHMNVTYLPDVPSVVPENVVESPRLPGYVAVSATVLDAVYSDRDFYKPLRDKEPVARIGNSIFVYWIDAPWW